MVRSYACGGGHWKLENPKATINEKGMLLFVEPTRVEVLN